MISEKSLRAAAKELNDSIGLDPKINVKGSVKDITEVIKEAITDCIKPDEDEFTDATQAVLDEIAATMKKTPAKGGKGKTKVEDVEEEEEETDDEDQDEDEDEDAEDEDEDTDDDEEEEEEEEEDPAPKKKGVPKKLANGYNRTDSVCEALLKGKAKNIADWVTKANALMVKNGGKANDSESKALIKLVSIVLKHVGTVKYPTA